MNPLKNKQIFDKYKESNGSCKNFTAGEKSLWIQYSQSPEGEQKLYQYFLFHSQVVNSAQQFYKQLMKKKKTIQKELFSSGVDFSKIFYKSTEQDKTLFFKKNGLFFESGNSRNTPYNRALSDSLDEVLNKIYCEIYKDIIDDAEKIDDEIIKLFIDNYKVTINKEIFKEFESKLFGLLEKKYSGYYLAEKFFCFYKEKIEDVYEMMNENNSEESLIIIKHETSLAEKANNLILSAAEKGDKDAQFWLYAYQEKDKNYWLHKAAKLGHEIAISIMVSKYNRDDDIQKSLDLLEPYKKPSSHYLFGFSEKNNELNRLNQLYATINLKQKNQQLELEIKEKEAAQKEAHNKEKEMLSFFTHTMRNALATAPESLRQAIRLLGSDDYEQNQKHYEAINEITSLFSTLSLTDCLIDTFKQSIYDTEEFQRNWQLDNSGDATPEWFIALALRQSLNRVMFMSSPRELKKLLNNDKSQIKPMRKSFIEQVLPLGSNQQDIELFYQWVRLLPTIEVNIEKTALHFGANQIKFSLLFAISSELTLNALKYWSGEGKIQIDWQLSRQHYTFRITNACKANANSQLAGTHKGLAFIQRLIDLLDEQGENASLNCAADQGIFSAELKLHHCLFAG